MNLEIFQSERCKKPERKLHTFRNAARAVMLAGGVTLTMAPSNYINSQPTTQEPNLIQPIPNIDITNSFIDFEKQIDPVSPHQQSRDEEIAGMLSDPKARIALATLLGLSLSATALMVTGKQVDEKLFHGIKIGAPSLASISFATALLDSYKDNVNFNVAPSMFLGATMLGAGYLVYNSFARERDLKVRASAITTAGFLVNLGVVMILAVNDKI